MVEAEASTIATVFVLTVSVMSFTTTSASNRIDAMQPGNMKFLSILSIGFAWCLLFLLAAMILGSGAFGDTPLLFGSLKVIFAAFTLPSLLLVFDLVDDLEDSWKADSFNRYASIAAFVVLLVFIFGLLQMEPPA